MFFLPDERAYYKPVEKLVFHCICTHFSQKKPDVKGLKGLFQSTEISTFYKTLNITFQTV